MQLLLCLPLLISQPTTDPIALPAGAVARLGSVHFRHSSHAFGSISPDGKLLVSVDGNLNDGMRLWDVESGKQLLFHPSKNKDKFVGGSFSSDGKLIRGGDQSFIELWDVAKRQTRARFKATEKGNRSVALSADSKTLAAHGWDGRCRVWDVESGNLKAEFECRATALALSHDGSTVLTAERPNLLRFRNAQGGKIDNEIKLAEDHFWVSWLVYSPHGDLLAVIDGTTRNDDRLPPMYFRILDAKTGKERYHLPLKWEDGFVSAFAFAPDGKTMLMARRPMEALPKGYQGYLEMRDVARGELLKTVPLPGLNYYNLSFTADGKRFALAGEELCVQIWNYPEFTRHLPPVGHIKTATSIAVAPDGKKAYSLGEDAALIAWDMKTYRPIKTMPVPPGRINDWGVASSTLALPDEHVAFVVWRGDDLKPRKGDIHVRRVSDGKDVQKIEAVSGDVVSSPDGKHLAAGAGATARLWDPLTGKTVRSFEGETENIRRLAFAHDGRVLASIHQDGTLCLWDVDTGRRLRRAALAREDNRDRFFSFSRPPSLSFSTDGRYLVSVYSRWSTTIQVWEVATGKEVRLIRLDKKVAQAPALLCMGRTLLMSNHWSAPQLFDLASGETLPNPIGDARVHGFVPVPDGRSFLAAGHDGCVLVWKTDVLKAPPLKKNNLPDDALPRLWADLAGPAGAAFAAQWDLAAVGDDAVRFIDKHLKPPQQAEQGIVAKRIAELGSENFKIRDQAFLDLERWGRAVEFDLRGSLKNDLPIETRRRLQALLDKIDGDPPPAELQANRAIGVLEAIGSEPAQAALKRIAAGTRGASITENAKAALSRLNR